MKVSNSGEKPKNLLDLVSNNSEAVKVSTRAKSSEVAGLVKSESAKSGPEVASRDDAHEKAISIKFGLAKYIAEELDPQKVTEARQAKIDAIKAQVANGTYLTSLKSEDTAQKILEESQLENLIVGRAANDE